MTLTWFYRFYLRNCVEESVNSFRIQCTFYIFKSNNYFVCLFFRYMLYNNSEYIALPILYSKYGPRLDAVHRTLLSLLWHLNNFETRDITWMSIFFFKWKNQFCIVIISYLLYNLNVFLSNTFCNWTSGSRLNIYYNLHISLS